MRAVNLIPAEQRRGAGGIAGRSGGIVYVLTGALAVVVILGVVYALAVHNVADNKGELASVTEQVTAVNAQSQALAPYVSFAGVTSTNVGQVTTLARQRFDWPSAMQQLALALPQDVTFTSFSGTSSAGVAGAVTFHACGVSARPLRFFPPHQSMQPCKCSKRIGLVIE